MKHQLTIRFKNEKEVAELAIDIKRRSGSLRPIFVEKVFKEGN